MTCPHCHREITFTQKCPYCRHSIHYNGNSEIYEHAVQNSLTLQDILTDVFRKHSHQELEVSLLRKPTNSDQMLQLWRKPWLFARLFAFLFTFSLLLFNLITQFNFASHMYIVFGCMVVPLTLMTFIWEMDIHSNVSIFDLILLLFFGGIISIVFAVQLFAYFPDSIPPFAAFIEEPAKLAICILFMHFSNRRYYALDGLAIGAAVAAGFAFMESIAYVYKDFPPAISLVTLRGVMAFYSHILYTAPFVGALAAVMHGRPFRKDHLKDPRFLRIFACGVTCHFIHNTGFEFIVLISNPYIHISVKQILECVGIWSVLLMMMRIGIIQALQTASSGHIHRGNPYQNPQLTPQPIPQPKPKRGQLRAESPAAPRELVCLRGQYGGRRIRLTNTKPLVLGRSISCNIRFNSTTVSGTHCQIRVVHEGIEVCDLQSKNGTYANGIQLRPNQTVLLRPGDTLGLDRNREYFTVH